MMIKDEYNIRCQLIKQIKSHIKLLQDRYPAQVRCEFVELLQEGLQRVEKEFGAAAV